MAKYYLPSLILLGLLSVFPMTAFAAWDTVQFLQDTNVYLSTPNVTSTVSAGSKVESMSVGTNSFSVTGAYVNANTWSSITFTSAQRPIFNNSLGLSTSCGSGSSSLTITWAATTPATVTVSIGGICATAGGVAPGGGAGGYAAGGGGGGAAPVTPTVPTTTSGEVTATASAGGKTSLTTTEGAKATVELPANAVTANTTVKITSVPTGNVVIAYPTPTGISIVSSFNLTATAAGAAVTSFAQPVTLTFTYTDAQVAGLNETSLKIYRWDGTQWVALPSTVNIATNTITATTTAFSYFAIMGQAGVTMTVEQLKAEIARITALILQLQAELAKLTGAVQPFTTDLYYGIRENSEVKRLQEFLISNGYLTAGFNTGNYLSLTVEAVKAYQTAKGITPVAGYFGPKTRAAVNAELGVSQ